MSPYLLLALTYLIGAVPSSYLVARAARGIDLREHGSGNLGATNTFRVLGWKLALPVLVFDIAKGFIPTFYFPQWDDSAAPAWALGYAVAAVVGHVFSLYVRFKGGKGVATSAGALLALAPAAVGAGFAIWTALVLLTRTVSLASIVAAAAVPIVVFALHGFTPIFWLCSALAAFIIYAHRKNIGRLLRGEEHRFGSKQGATP